MLQKSKEKIGVEGWRRWGALGDGKQNLGAKWLWQMKWKEESQMMSQVWGLLCSRKKLNNRSLTIYWVPPPLIRALLHMAPAKLTPGWCSVVVQSLSLV